MWQKLVVPQSEIPLRTKRGHAQTWGLSRHGTASKSWRRSLGLTTWGGAFLVTNNNNNTSSEYRVLTSSLTVFLGADGTGSPDSGDGAAQAAGRSIDDGDWGNGSGQFLDGEPESWDDDGLLNPATGGVLQYGENFVTSSPAVSGPPANREDHRQRITTSSEEPESLFRGNGAARPVNTRKKNTKAAIRIASLNMKGYHAADPLNPGTKLNKWNHINQIMRDEGLAVLVLQETHLTEDRKDELERLFPKLLILASYDHENPSGRAGIAVVIHKDKMLTEEITVNEIRRGRAMMVQTKWHSSEQNLTILAVYAPNDGAESENFFIEIKNFLETNNQLGSPDVMLGDFNVVENAIDRLPMHSDREKTVEALEAITDKYNLLDGWRKTYPTTKDYSFMQSSTDSRSRIDRIYVLKKIMEDARQWRIDMAGIPTDHMLVSAQIAHHENPDIGPGRWTMKFSSIRNQKATAYAKKEGLKAAQEIEDLRVTGRSAERNPQTIWYEYKVRVAAKMKKLDREERCILDTKIRTARSELHKAQNSRSLTEEERRVKAGELTRKLEELVRTKHTKRRDNLATKSWVDGEIMTKEFARRGKGSKPRDNIKALKKEGGTEQKSLYEKCSWKMADMAREYHDKLQDDTLEQSRVLEDERREVIEDAVRKLDPKLDNEEVQFMEQLLTEEQVLEALKLSDNGKAAGLDGTIYELYKTLHERFTEDRKCNRDAFNIIATLMAVFNDIELHGVVDGTKFSEGWMCPFYKKNDCTEIANYRPITLLNADYKIFTKALTFKLTKVAGKLINLDQAGFMPNRKITDHTELVKLVMDYAEAYDVNRMIVALDQEKVYDKIAHDYLFCCLQQFGFPEHFINIIKSIYRTAEMRVMINGYLSKPFQVRRGVRQGDPMSCLLFNFAIEPLATSLRKSALRGIPIPNCDENLLVKLFADDTMAFLSEGDDFHELREILETWCKASKAKFNIAKTEILPIGNVDFRERLIEQRVMTVGQRPIPDDIPIMKEGECMRVLGSWVGNNMDVEKPWKMVLKKIEKSLTGWEKCHPSMEERRHVVNAVQGAMTQYLMTVQDIPESILEELDRNIRRFIWGDKTNSPVCADYLFAPIGQGGKKVLDIRARAEAIIIMRLKTYLNLGETRPLWAKVADALFAKHVTKKEMKLSEPRVRQNVFLQSWSTSDGHQSKLPKRLKLLVKTAKKYGLRLDALAMTKRGAREMPIWFHIEADKEIRHKNKQKASRCLRDRHNVSTVGDTEEMGRCPADHREKPDCECLKCREMRDNLGCKNPDACIRMAISLLDTLPKRWDPRSDQTIESIEEMAQQNRGDNSEDEDEETWTSFNPETAVTDKLADAFRIVTNGNKAHGDVREILGNMNSQISIILATDGACDNNGMANAKAGAGVFYDNDDPRNISVRVPKEFPQTNQTGEILAAERALAEADPDANMKMELDSRYVINALTKNLQSNENAGYVGVENKNLLMALVARARQRKTKTQMKWVKGHSGHNRNEGADEAARMAIEEELVVPIDLKIPENAYTSGIRLATATQSLVYRAIRQKKLESLKERQRTKNMIEIVVDDLERCCNVSPTEPAIWKAIRHKDFSKQFRYFAWMVLHDAYMTGTKWDRENYPQEKKDRAFCDLCGGLDNLDHILFRCEAPGQSEIWDLTRELWALRNEETPCPEMSLGTVVGSALVKLEGKTKKIRAGNERLWRIVTSESVYLIWKIWCKRKIGGENTSVNAIKNLWVHTMNTRLRLDCRLTAPHLGRKGIPKGVLNRTWSSVLRDNSLPLDWKSSGVLVGIAANRTGRRGREEDRGGVG
jgi:ribonuclease HI/exonuclease III